MTDSESGDDGTYELIDDWDEKSVKKNDRLLQDKVDGILWLF